MLQTIFKHWKPGLFILIALIAAVVVLVLLPQRELPTAPTPPDYRTIDAAKSSELSRAAALIEPDYFDGWSRSNGNAMSNRYSSLAQVNRTNVSTLKVAWTYKSEHPGVVQANPIVINGMVVLPIPGNYIVALDGTTGKELWRFQTEGKPAIRGLVWWPGDSSTDSRIYFASANNVYALSLEGKPVAEFGNNGIVARDGQSLVAPAIAKGILVYPVRGTAKVEGLDVVTGEVRWITPLLEPLPRSAETVDSTYLGANPWSGISVDEERGLVFVTTGNPKPAFVGVSRPGDNKHSDSLVAIDVRNGNIVWSFQEIAHDVWDKDVPAPPILTQIMRDGEVIDVVVTVTKHGNTILLDRVSGKPIYPWRLRRAPDAELRGEQAAQYQPDVELPEPFSKQEFSAEDLTNLGSENFEFSRKVLEQANAGFFPAFAEGKDSIFFGIWGGAEWPGGAVDPYTQVLYVASNDVPWRVRVVNVAGLDQINFRPSRQQESYLAHCERCHGSRLQGVDDHPVLYGVEERRSEEFIRQIVHNGLRNMPSFNHLEPATVDDVVEYIQSVKPEVDQQLQAVQKTVPPRFHFTGWRMFTDHEGYPANKPPWGWLNALNLNTGRIIWKVPLGKDKLLEERGFGTVGTFNLGGPVVTAGGLVFVAGTTDNLIRAFDKETGEEVWSHELPFMGSAPPSIYMMDGRQFLLVPATGGELENPVGNAFVAFSLPVE